MNELQIFTNDEFGQVRTVTVNGKPHLIATDVTRALGYVNANDAVKKHCRWVAKCYIPHPQSTGKSLEVNAIPEGDLYRLISHSELPAAEKFESWVFDEVLPSIRKHGMYATEELLDNPDLLIKVASALKEERERNKLLTHEVQIKTQIIGELKPKADYVDKILKNPGLMTITQIAKDYGMSGQAMNELLHSKGIQYKQSGQWLLYQKYHDMGYTHSDTVEFERSGGVPGTKLNTKWTQKGRLFIYNTLKESGVVPVIEKFVA